MRGYAWPVFGTIVLVFLLVVAASVAAALIGLALGDVSRAILSWIFNALTQPVAALTTSVLYFALLQVSGRDSTGIDGPASTSTPNTTSLASRLRCPTSGSDASVLRDDVRGQASSRP